MVGCWRTALLIVVMRGKSNSVYLLAEALWGESTDLTRWLYLSLFKVITKEERQGDDNVEV